MLAGGLAIMSRSSGPGGAARRLPCPRLETRPFRLLPPSAWPAPATARRAPGRRGPYASPSPPPPRRAPGRRVPYASPSPPARAVVRSSSASERCPDDGGLAAQPLTARQPVAQRADERPVLTQLGHDTQPHVRAVGVRD